ncbi:MAG: hypothetical protein GY866_14140 [Proteobacteria bacterium]|nr:hypothetical protein [Pseudomonadota bacterium]
MNTLSVKPTGAQDPSGRSPVENEVGRPKLWIYNYDFDFELAKMQKKTFTGSNFFPWFFLNRSTSILVPFTQPGDSILAYQEPPKFLRENVSEKLGFLPEFLTIEPTVESNSVWEDAVLDRRILRKLGEFRLMPWGWSPRAVSANNQYGFSKAHSDLEGIVRQLNSKQYSHYLRRTCLSDSFSIPALDLNRRKISLDELKSILIQFHRSHSDFYVKHYFGSAGKLSDCCRSQVLSTRKIKKWKTWINQAGGILLEKKVIAVAEWSIQMEIDPNGRPTPIGLTRLLSGRDGSYQGTIVGNSYRDLLDGIFESLAPVFQKITETGYSGPLGIDLIETKKEGLKLLEINCRLTMGRVALEWHRTVNSHPVGLFTNLFFKNKRLSNGEKIIDIVDRLESEFQCSIAIVNQVSADRGDGSMVTVFLGADSERILWRVFGDFKRRLATLFVV